MIDVWEATDGPPELLGDYKMTITEFRVGKSSAKQTPFVEFTLTDGELSPKVTLYITEKSLWRFARFCKAAGATKDGFNRFNLAGFADEWDDNGPSRRFLKTELVGKAINIRFDWDKPNYQGEVYSIAVDYWGGPVAPKDPTAFVRTPKPKGGAPAQRGGRPPVANNQRPDIAGGAPAQAQDAEKDELPF